MFRLAIVLGAVVFIAGCGTQERDISAPPAVEPADQRPAKADDPSVTWLYAETLTRRYSSNEVSADSMYKGYWLDVKGKIDRVGVDIAGKPFVLLRDRNGDSLCQAQFFFADRGSVAKLQAGQMVVIRGKCTGKVVNVLLVDCAIMPQAP